MDYNQNNENLSDTNTLSDYYWAIVKRRWMVLLIIITIIFLVALFAIRQPKIYTSIASVEINMQADNVLSGLREVYTLGDMSYYHSDSYYKTQYTIIQSRAVLSLVVERLHLDRDLEFLGLSTIDDKLELEESLAKTDPIKILQAGLVVEPVKDSRLVQIKYSGTDPEKIALIANTISESYIEQNLERKLSSTRDAIKWMIEQLSDLKETLEKSELALYQFRKENNIIVMGVDDKFNTLSVRLEELYRLESKAESDYFRAKTRYEAALRGVPDLKELKLVGAMPIVENQVYRTLKDTQVKLANKYSELTVKYKSSHPDVKIIKSQLDQTTETLRQEIINILEALHGEFLATQDTWKNLKNKRVLIEDKARTLTLKSVEYNRLIREKESNLRVYNQVMLRLKEINLSGMLKVNNIRQLEQALVPKRPVSPRINLMILLGIIMGISLGISTAIILEVFDKTLKNTDDIERFLRLPLLGIVPKVKVEDVDGEDVPDNIADLYAFRNPQSSLTECCRTIRTNINFSSPGKQLKKILITSASPKEGKTTIVSNVAITIANAGKRVLIVDTDLRRPRIHKAFNFENDYGLMNVIMGNMTIEEATKTTEIENLYVLACGPIPPNPAELIGSEQFHAIVDQLSDMYDWVFFDSPPVIAVTDSSILSDIVDGVILVVKHGKTLREVAIQARKQLLDVKANILGVVMNSLDFDNRKSNSYYYHYYNRYGYYYGEEKDQGSKKKKRKKVKVNSEK